MEDDAPRPTTERILDAFQDITLTIIQEPHRNLCHLTSLSQLQQRILTLLGAKSRLS